MFDIFYIGEKDAQFCKLKEKFFTIKQVDNFFDAKLQAITKFFWCVWADVLVKDDFDFDYVPDSGSQNIPHVFLNGQYADGIWLIPKKNVVREKEIEHRFLVHKKEVDIVASIPKSYDKFMIDTFDDYLFALGNTKTELFWTYHKDIEINYDFSLYFQYSDRYNRKTNHTLVNIENGNQKENGIFLLSVHQPLSEKEISFKHIVKKKPWNIIASKHKPYDVVFISYNESFADQNFQKLLKTYPAAKRIHGVKGIHQAHIEAAKISSRDMFWIVDADAVIVNDFDFEYFVERWDRDAVHVWRSQNPINNLVYGYGGVKLFPRQLTIDMDLSKPDMTTSITDKFKAMNTISNITAFNTDPFNTWKSAFRECCKLAAKVIDRQKNQETEDRLDIWCTVGADKPYGEHAILGAEAGRKYGYTNQGNITALQKINDFDWLKEVYEKY